MHKAGDSSLQHKGGDMTQKRRKVSLGFCDEKQDEGFHIIYLYNDDYERKRTMAKFLQEGIQEGEKVLYLVHDVSPSDMRLELGEMGVDTDTAQKAFEMMDAHYKHCPGEVFSKEYMLGLVGEYYENALKDGYVGARGAGEMSWAAENGRAELKDLIEYEARLNSILAEHPLTTVCQYNVRLFSGEVIMDLLSVHPLSLVRGQLVRNPFYIPPDVFLNGPNQRVGSIQ
jgi:hypothetical protein